MVTYAESEAFAFAFGVDAFVVGHESPVVELHDLPALPRFPWECPADFFV